MRKWSVTVSTNIPYTWSRVFCIEARTPAAAIREALKLYRIALKLERFIHTAPATYDIQIGRIEND